MLDYGRVLKHAKGLIVYTIRFDREKELARHQRKKEKEYDMECVLRKSQEEPCNSA